jgi:hypothetical protein
MFIAIVTRAIVIWKPAYHTKNIKKAIKNRSFFFGYATKQAEKFSSECHKELGKFLSLNKAIE